MSQPPKIPSPPSVPGETSIDCDPLVPCLERIARFHQLPFELDTATAGLPLEEGRMTPSILLRAARRCGLRGKVVKRKLKAIPVGVTPVIVFLNEGKAGVLEPGEGGDDEILLFLPTHDGGTMEEAPLSLLNHAYTGYAMFFQPCDEYSDENSAARPEFDEPEARQMWFWKTMWRFRGYYAQLLPGSLLINLFAVAMPFFIMLVYDRVVPNEALETLWVLAIGVGTVFTFEFIIRLLRGTILERAGKEIDQILASSLFEQVLSIEMKARPSSAGVLTGRLKAYETLREFFMSASMLAITDLPFGFLMMLVIFYIGGPVGWVLVIAAALAIFVEVLIQGPLRKSVTSSVSTSVQRQAFISETVSAMETVKGCNAEGHLQRRLERMMQQASGSEVKTHWYGLIGSSTTAFIMHMTTVAVVIFSVYRVHAGDMTMGAMIACVMLGSRCMAPISMVTGLMTRMQHALEALKGLNGVMKLPRETGDGRKFLAKNRIINQFELREVTAKYPDQAQPALEKVSLTFKPGERVAILGKIGSGKSTLLRILAKLYDPESGEILLDGVELAQYHPAAVRNLVGYLPQDATLFEGTLRENLALGSRNASDAELYEALNFAGLEDMVKAHPKGIHMPVGERGIMLSGGQRQSVALARSFVSQSAMLLLDEPTAAMDRGSENRVKASICSYLDQDKTRSLIMVTHKMSMLDIVERIIVIEKGRVVANGPSEEILKKLKQPKNPGATPES
ncbi:MAG: type I secretion system permease/ATPase [Verrucomicrobiales bacterium]|nr:type I secretion system permease/ATPase [Verrucomicrobiales bacterium]